VGWAAKEAAKYAWKNLSWLQEADEATAIQLISTAHERTSGEAAERGDGVHDSAETYVKGKPDGKNLKHMRQLEDFFEVSQYEPLFTEVTVVNRTIGYAGTADLIAADPHKGCVLIDYKTGNGVYPEHLIQVEALSRAEFILTPEGEEIVVPTIFSVGVLHLRPLSWWFYLNADGSSSERNWQAFLSAKGVADWRRLHPAMVFGPLEKMNRRNWAA